MSKNSPSFPRTGRSGLVLAIVLGLGLAACGSDQGATPATTTLAPEPEPTVAVGPSSTVPVTASTAPGRPRTVTTLPADISGGLARIAGTVVGPQGPVPGANIRVERLTGTEVSVLNITATSNGAYNIPSVRGGHYRLRAWRAPDLLMTQPEAFFLAADEQKSLELRLTNASDLNLQVVTDPPPPLPKEELFNIVVTVYAGKVSSEGLLEGTTRNGLALQFAVGQNLGLQGADRGTTDASGKATFRVKCIGAGPTGADVIVGTTRIPLTLPTCPS